VTLEFHEGVERPEEIPGDGSVVAEIGVPAFRRHEEKADSDCIVRVEFFGTVFDLLPRQIALGCSRGVEHASLDETGAEPAPMRLSQTQDESFFGRAVRLKGLAEAVEDLFVLVPVLLGKDDDCGGGQAVLEAVEAASLFAFFGPGPSQAAVAAIGGDLAL
jgi:hypothetical protein